MPPNTVPVGKASLYQSEVSVGPLPVARRGTRKAFGALVAVKLNDAVPENVPPIRCVNLTPGLAAWFGTKSPRPVTNVPRLSASVAT